MNSRIKYNNLFSSVLTASQSWNCISLVDADVQTVRINEGPTQVESLLVLLNRF